ncbi:MAG: translocation/assembly module TamB domain-containing protein [Candidatus Zixiibacteriota bacterium]
MRKRFKIPLWTLSFVLVVGVGTYIWLTQSPWLKNRLVDRINRTLQPITDVRVGIGSLSGNVLSCVGASGIVITAPGRGGTLDTLVTVGQLVLAYDVRTLLSEGHVIDSIRLSQVRLFLPRDSLAARWRSLHRTSASEGGIRGAFDLSLRSIIIEDAALWRVGDTVPIVDAVRMDALLAAQKGDVHLRLWDMSAHSHALGSVSAAGRCDITSAGWVCDSLVLRAGQSDLLLSGTADRWRVQGRPLVLDDVEAIVHLGIRGRLNVDGKIRADWEGKRWTGDVITTGTLEGFVLQDVAVRFTAEPGHLAFDSISGNIADARWHGTAHVDWEAHPIRWSYTGNVRDLNLERLAEGTYTSDFSGFVRLEGLGSTGDDLRVRGDVDMSAGVFDDVHFQRARGAIGVTSDSLILGGDFTVELNGTTFVGGGTVAFADSLDLFADVTCGDLSRWDPMIFIDSLAGRGSGRIILSGLTRDPDLEGTVASDTLRMYDLYTNEFSARFSVPRFLYERAGTVEAHWGRSSTWDVATDSIELKARLMAHDVVIDWAHWSSPNVDVEGAGWLNWSADTVPVQLYPLTIQWDNQHYSAGDSVSIVVDSVGFRLAPLSFEGPLGVVHAEGRFDYDTRMDLGWEVEQFRLESLWRRFFPTVELAGLLEARGRLQGTFAAPRFSLTGALSDLSYQDRDFGDLEGALFYEDKRLVADWLRLKNPDFQVDASGTFPIDLSFETVDQRVLAEPLSGRLSASGDNLDRIVSFWPQTLESIHGSYSLSATVGGTPQSPLFSGSGTMRSARVKALEIVNPIEDVQVDLTLRQDTIRVDKATGIVRDGRKRGRIRAVGSLLVESYDRFDYDLTVTGRDVPARFEFEDYAVTTDFDLTVKGSTPPIVKGTIHPLRVDDHEPLAAEPEAPVIDTTLWDWDMLIDMPGNYWLRNDQIEAELSADLRLVRSRGQVNYIGTAEFVRGKIYLLDKVGQIKRGVITFDDPVQPNPQLDIDVVFRIQQPRVQATATGSSSQVVDLNLHIGGRASEPLIQPEAPYTEQDVLLLLATNTTSGSGGSDTTTTGDPLANRLKFAATGLLLSEVQRAAARRLGLETLEINSLGGLNAQITVGRYVSPHLYLYGSSPIDVAGGQEVGFEYRLGRHVFLEGNRDKDSRYRLNLHFNWDY